MTAMTVTATQSNSGSSVSMLTVVVFTGYDGIGETVSTFLSSTDTEITPQADGSFVYGGLAAHPNNTYSANAQSTVIDTLDLSDLGAASFYATDPTTADTPVTVGCIEVAETARAISLVEVLSDGSLAVDDSSPDTVKTFGSSNTMTTTSFDPPDGSLIVAIAMVDSSTFKAVVTDSLSNEWTRQCDTAGGSFLPNVTIWTTEIGGTSVDASISASPVNAVASIANAVSNAGSTLSAGVVNAISAIASPVVSPSGAVAFTGYIRSSGAQVGKIYSSGKSSSDKP